jgi:hypothetical protein
MELARSVGINVAPSEVTQRLGRDVLLVERFDRTAVPAQQRMLVSALTMLGLDDMMSRYASYHALADLIRRRFTAPDRTLRDLFSRMVFSICIGNTDDHACNHAAFWDGTALTLTPAYDLCPQLRSETEANQAMAIGRDGQRQSRLRGKRTASSSSRSRSSTSSGTKRPSWHNSQLRNGSRCGIARSSTRSSGWPQASCGASTASSSLRRTGRLPRRARIFARHGAPAGALGC